MSSSTTSKNSLPEPFPFARDGGMPYRAAADQDPFEAWMSLMEAVEALCPEWPEREVGMKGTFKL